MFALIDCNNFYASCERLFRPDLRTTPIVVLSSNDGCVIARSNEARALVAMGEPYFKIRAICRAHGIAVFSSNFALYGDLSARVMQVIEQASDRVEIYSIDEVFLDLTGLSPEACRTFCETLRAKILRWTGIPTSIGLGTTKTLAKMANHVAKRILGVGVLDITEQRAWLSQIPVGEVWGVGRQWQRALVAAGIFTAQDLVAADMRMLRTLGNVRLQRVALELQGVICEGLAQSQPAQSIVSSRSFGAMQDSFEALAGAVSGHCRRAWTKLRRQGMRAGALSVFVLTNRYRPDLPQYSNRAECRLARPVDSLRELTRVSRILLERIYREGYAYKKVGVCFDALTPLAQASLFDEPNEQTQAADARWMHTFEAVQRRFGRDALYLAAEGIRRPWAARAGMCSPNYTTQWSALPRVRLSQCKNSSRLV
ncbi:Y-family DNA polymerase [Legionella geestiana]|uniref:Y-family DNA polymerase n=1 Tax=Legionella geestiana TaxID=45065 RepID=UPI0010927575|nr:Y-family DNA polymerase [Legionella geestiana]QDQ39267.1 Y-family DNA polymerase [Legionella geestiana]